MKNTLCQKEDATELEAQTGATPATPNSLTIAPYTVFSRSTIRLLTALIGIASIFSSLSANIYFPSISILSRSLRTSIQNINLTITSYIVVQAIAPAFLGGLADNVGRRPIYLITFSVYVLANLGLALQNTYPALLVLRMLQSFGCSAAIAIGFGVASDVAVPAERGRILGPASIAMNLGTCLGPTLGGLLAKNVGWRWMFWVLLIVGASSLLILAALLPETARSVVGNGEIETSGWNRPLLHRAEFKTEKSTRQSSSSLDHSNKRLKTRDLWRNTNPFTSLRLLFHRDIGLVVWSSAIVYAAYYVIQASMPQILEDKYGFDEQQVGLSYLAIGGGVVIGGYANGKLLDWNYRKTAKTFGITPDVVAGDDISSFPIEKARTRMSYAMILLDTVLLLGYGWTVKVKAHVSAALIFQFLLGIVMTIIVQLWAVFMKTFNALLVDINPRNPSAAAASGNIGRCTLAAGSVAAMQPLLDGIGTGWFFTLVGLMTGVGGVIAIGLMRWKGMAWRQQRKKSDI